MKTIALDYEVHSILRTIAWNEGRNLKVVIHRILRQDPEFQRLYALNHPTDDAEGLTAERQASAVHAAVSSEQRSAIK
jgi:hypothetical protein